jgi:nitrite reductase/ring-hydroxylating ferredoxin subunit
MTEPSSDSIGLDEIAEGKINPKVLSSGRKAVILRRGDDVTAIGEICPHMGGDLTRGRYCAREKTLQCPWHGYIFSVETGDLLKNPNEDMVKPLRVPSAFWKPEKTPRYRLQRLPCQLRDGKVHIGREGSS